MDDQQADVLAQARLWKGGQLREMGFPDFFDNPQTMAFFQTLRQRGHLVSSTLRAGGRLVSLWIGYVHEGSWSGWIFAHDPELKKYSPGHQLLIRMLEESFRLGHREFDFSGCAQDYKMLYATHGRLIGDIGTPSPLRAMVLFARKVMRKYTPGLFTMALRAKWLLNITLKRRPLRPVTPSER
jgi:CelD/BcsL family acetyltransferase involved in cellulose biosynthesis